MATTLGDRIIIALHSGTHVRKAFRYIFMNEEGLVSVGVHLETLAPGRPALLRRIQECGYLSNALSTYEIDTIGDALVRKHLGEFTKILMDMTEEEYETNLLGATHLHFTISGSGSRGSIMLRFHVSYLHDAFLDQFMTQVEDEPS